MQRFAPIAPVGLIAIAAAACSGSSAQHDYPKLAPGDGVETKPKAAPADAALATNVLFGPDGSACMPVGVYDVTFDLASAQLTSTGQSDEVCRSLLASIAAQTLHELKLEVEAGALAIYWPTRAIAIVKSPCEFEITSPPVVGTFTFHAATGTGVVNFAVSAADKPGNRCAAIGAKLTIIRASS